MIKFTTETGSIYEMDEIDGRIRRLSGNHAPTSRQGEDGSWRNYHGIRSGGVQDNIPFAFNNGPVLVGQRMLIIWNEEGQCTLTSVVVDIEIW